VAIPGELGLALDCIVNLLILFGYFGLYLK